MMHYLLVKAFCFDARRFSFASVAFNLSSRTKIQDHPDRGEFSAGLHFGVRIAVQCHLECSLPVLC